MHSRMFATALGFALCLAAKASVIVVNFETVPVLPTGPSLFAAAGPMQTIVVPNVATFTGGVVLGNASSFPAQSFATPPNVYGTAGFGDPTLLSTLTIAVSPSFPTTEVSFPVFNGATSVESYEVTAFSGATQVASQTLSNLPANTSSGFGTVDLKAANITSVTVAPTALDATCCSGWDFVIDTVAFNEPVQATVPEPSTLVTLGVGLGVAVAMRRRKA